MSNLPTKAQVLTLDYAFGAQPATTVPAHSGSTDNTLDYAFGAHPVTFYDTSGGGGGGGGGARRVVIIMF